VKGVALEVLGENLERVYHASTQELEPDTSRQEVNLCHCDSHFPFLAQALQVGLEDHLRAVGDHCATACGQAAACSEACQTEMKCIETWLLTSEARCRKAWQDSAKLREEAGQLRDRLQHEEQKQTAAEAAVQERDAQLASLKIHIDNIQSEVSSLGHAYF
jgi:hypothetical protein